MFTLVYTFIFWGYFIKKVGKKIGSIINCIIIVLYKAYNMKKTLTIKQGTCKTFRKGVSSFVL